MNGRPCARLLPTYPFERQALLELIRRDALSLALEPQAAADKAVEV